MVEIVHFRYHVSFSGFQLEQIARWYAWSKRVGLEFEFLKCIRTMTYRMEYEPLEWGDPVTRMKGMNAYKFHGVSPMLNVWYAVHRVQPQVFVSRVQFRGDVNPKPPDWDAY